MAAAKFGPNDYCSSRPSAAGSWRFRLDRKGRPEFSQWLPAPLRPEGLLAIPHRNLLIASGETNAAATACGRR